MITPILLAGGTGTRLWPASRKSIPKQFVSFDGESSLFHQALQRFKAPIFDAPLVITGHDWRFIVADHLHHAGIENADVLLEPEGRNTAPAILSAALRMEQQPEAIMLVCPSDHRISGQAAFMTAVSEGAEAAARGDIVTFGIPPTGPETSYGYLALSVPPEPGVPQTLRGFTEKPDRDLAQAMVEGGRHYWNSGIFMFRVDTIIAAFEALMPEMIMPCRAALAHGVADLGFFCLDHTAYRRCESISIDYGIMEGSNALTVIPAEFSWSDMGSWKAVWGTGPKDTEGNALVGAATQVDCRNTLVYSDKPDRHVVALGLDNIAAIATDDAILVTSLDAGERVREVVAQLSADGAHQAENFRHCHRPWGHYETLALGARFQVKQIVVKPGGKLSLQSHMHRSEHWIVVAGTATVTVGETRKMIGENQSVYIPLGEIHRLENEGKVPLTLIEVQSGPYLGEDDIIRYDDVYARDTSDQTAAA